MKKHGNTGNQHAAKATKADARITWRLPKASKEAYTQAAEAEGLKLTQWIERELTRAIEEQQK